MVCGRERGRECVNMGGEGGDKRCMSKGVNNGMSLKKGVHEHIIMWVRECVCRWKGCTQIYVDE